MKAINTIFTVVTLAATIIGCDGGYYDADTGEFVGVSEETVGVSEDEVVAKCDSGNYDGGYPWALSVGIGEDTSHKKAKRLSLAACNEDQGKDLAKSNADAAEAKEECLDLEGICTQDDQASRPAQVTQECKVIKVRVRHIPPAGPALNNGEWCVLHYPGWPDSEEDCDDIMTAGERDSGQREFEVLSQGLVRKATNSCTPVADTHSEF